LLILAELNGKKIGPHGTSGTTTGGGGGVTDTFTEVEQLPPGHGWSQRVRSVATFTLTVIVPEAPVVSSVTSVPLVDESCPPVADQE
jgi:hypothetical protein